MEAATSRVDYSAVLMFNSLVSRSRAFPGSDSRRVYIGVYGQRFNLTRVSLIGLLRVAPRATQPTRNARSTASLRKTQSTLWNSVAITKRVNVQLRTPVKGVDFRYSATSKMSGPF